VLKDRQADASLMALRSPIPVRRARSSRGGRAWTG
jgi:hypothetical protein